MVRRSIFMPPRSRAGADASAHVGHAPYFLDRRGGAGGMRGEKEQFLQEQKKDLDEVTAIKAKIIDLIMKIQTPGVIKRCYNYIVYIYLHND